MSEQIQDPKPLPAYSLCEDCPCQCTTKEYEWIVNGCGKRAHYESQEDPV